MSYGFGRGLPLAAIVRDSLAPVLVGSDASVPEAVRSAVSNAYWSYAERGLFAVAASAVDLALWDLLGKRVGSPLADLLGKAREGVPVCGVGGYAREGEDALDSLQAEMRLYAEAGTPGSRSRSARSTPQQMPGGSPPCARSSVPIALWWWTRPVVHDLEEPCAGCACWSRSI